MFLIKVDIDFYSIIVKPMLLTLVMTIPVLVHAQFFEKYFEQTGKTMPYVKLLSTASHVESKEDAIANLAHELNWELQSNRVACIGDDTIHIIKEFDHQFYTSPNSKNEVHRISSSKGDELYKFFNKARRKIDWHTGNEDYRGFIHQIEIKVDKPTSIAIMAYAGYDLFLITHKLGFAIPDRSDELSDELQAKIFQGASELHDITTRLAKVVLTSKSKLQLPNPSKTQLSVEERLYGLSKFWSEVNYNFAFFHQVPDLDWDFEYQKLIPEITKPQSDYKYYQKLRKFCALLNDGHTNIYLPNELRKKEVYPPVRLKMLENKVIVTNIADSLEHMLPVGTEITHVNDSEVKEYLKKEVIPYISASTAYIKQNNAAGDLLKGVEGRMYTLRTRTYQGQVKEVKLICNKNSNINWVKKRPRWKLTETDTLDDNIFYISLNSFRNPKVIDEFEKHLGSIKKSNGLIIDLRKNGGGNSSNGYGIIKYLTDKSFVTSTWATREHRGSYKAWGIGNVGYREEARHAKGNHLNDWERTAWQYAKGIKWYVSNPDTITPSDSIYLDLPIVVLMGNNTASAAEDFLIAASDIENITTMGQHSFGSTGQPLMIDMPGGGRARICTKKDTYPNGDEFVGYGIKPDILIEETIGELITSNDRTLVAARKLLKRKIQK